MNIRRKEILDWWLISPPRGSAKIWTLRSLSLFCSFWVVTV